MSAERSISGSAFGDGTKIHLGDNTVIHNHNSTVLRKACYVIPFPRNQDIVQRPEIAAQLDQLLSSSKEGDYCEAALWGLGGSGKTQIALDYAYRRSRDDPACAIFWVHADSESSFARDYQTIAKKLGLDHTINGDDLFLTVRHCIESQTRWLLILDNADDLTRFGVDTTSDHSKSLRSYIPHGPGGTILWTSRDEHIHALAGSRQSVQVPHMVVGEAKDLLAVARNESIRDDEIQDAEDLLQELQWLPLAISQAGSYMRRTSTPIKTYLSRLSHGKSRWDTLKKTQHDKYRRPDIPNSILETWDISIQHIRQESETAYKVLHTIAYIDNENIPQRFICDASTSFDQPEQEQSSESNEEVLESVITRLKEFSFISARRNENGDDPSFDMHKLVQEAIRFRLHTKDTTLETQFSSTALRVISGVFPQEFKSKTRFLCEQYATHATRVCDWVEMMEDVTATTDFLVRMSDYFQYVGVMKKAECVAEKALDLRKKAFGEEDGRICVPLSKLGGIYLRQDRYEDAERLALELVKVSGKAFSEYSPNTIRYTSLLASAYHRQGRYEEAEEMFVKIISHLLEVEGEKYIHTITAMEILASIYEQSERYPEAIELRIKALALHSEAFGRQHPTTVYAMGNLADAYVLTGQTKEAEELDLKLLALGNEFPWEQYIDGYDIQLLSVPFFRKSLNRKARHVQRRFLASLQQNLGERNLLTVRIMVRLATALTVDKEYEEAVQLQLKALACFRDLLGDKNDETISAMGAAANMYYFQFLIEPGKQLELKALSLLQEVYGDKPPPQLRSELETIAYVRTETSRQLQGLSRCGWWLLELLAYRLATGRMFQLLFLLYFCGSIAAAVVWK